MAIRSPLSVSVKGQYALSAMLDLAAQPPREPVKIAAIARRRDIPQKFLELILAGLKQGGFVESRRGAGGGYLLARPADSITVGEVLRYVEGPHGAAAAAKAGPGDPFDVLWHRVDEAVSAVIDRATFAAILREWRLKQSQYVPNWDI